METLSRTEAAALGVKRFFTAIPCRRGHISERLVSNGHCAACCLATSKIRSPEYKARRAAKRKAIRDANPAKRSAAWRKKMDPQKRRAQAKRHYEKHAAQHRGYTKKWRLKNIEHRKAYSARHVANNLPYYAHAAAKRRAVKRQAIPKWADLDSIEAIYRRASELVLTVDHVVPLQSKIVCGLHCEDNLQLLSASENSQKSNTHWPDMP